jgi:hypothetical protein
MIALSNLELDLYLYIPQVDGVDSVLQGFELQQLTNSNLQQQI